MLTNAYTGVAPPSAHLKSATHFRRPEKDSDPRNTPVAHHHYQEDPSMRHSLRLHKGSATFPHALTENK